MDVYDLSGNLLNEYDLKLGRLKLSHRLEHHESVPPIEEVSRWDEKRYPNGGISRRKVIEREAVPGVDAWDEEIPIYIYIPYSEEELLEIEQENNKPTQEDRIFEIEKSLSSLLGGVLDTQT